jgi:hypothetical protein
MRASASAIALLIIWTSLRENFSGSFADSVMIHSAGHRTHFISAPGGNNVDTRLTKRVATNALSLVPPHMLLTTAW